MRLRRSLGQLRRDEGQSLVEFVMVAPLLLIIFLGTVEAATLYDRQHALEGLSREGANIASRGADLDQVVDLLVRNGATIGLGELGGAVVSRIQVAEGLAEIVGQEGSSGYVVQSRLGSVGESAVSLAGLGLVDGSSIHVVEIFYRYQAFTPLGSFVSGAVPQGLYSRAVF